MVKEGKCLYFVSFDLHIPIGGHSLFYLYFQYTSLEGEDSLPVSMKREFHEAKSVSKLCAWDTFHCWSHNFNLKAVQHVY